MMTWDELSFVWNRIREASPFDYLRTLSPLVLLAGFFAWVHQSLPPGWLAQAYFWLGVFVAATIVLRFAYRYVRSSVIPDKTLPPNPLDPQSIRQWKRDEYVGEIMKAMTAAEPPQIAIITGRSGAGKSYLVRELLADPLKGAGWTSCGTVLGFAGPQQFRDSVAGCIAETPHLELTGANTDVVKLKTPAVTGPKTVLILEHFEQLLSEPLSNEDPRQWFRDVMSRLLKHPNLCVIIVLRREFVLDLEHLLSTVHCRKQVFEVRGLALTTGIRASLEKATGQNTELADILLNDLRLKTDEALPLEVHLVELMLQDVAREKRGRLKVGDYVTDLRAAGLIDRYFERATEGRDEEVRRSVLYAFCVSPQRRRRLSVEDVAKVTHRDIESVGQALTRLKDSGVIVEDEQAQHYEIAHDYFASHFREQSGTLIEPLNRDNINHFVARLERGALDVAIPETPKKLALLDLVYGTLLLVLLARLFVPELGAYEAAKLAPYRAAVDVTAANRVDLLYLPALIASAFTSLYSFRLHKNFLFAFSRGFVSRLASGSTAALCLVMVLAGVLVPRAWPLFAGIAGIMMGIRLTVLGLRLSKRRVRRPLTHNYVRDIGLGMFINMLAVTGLALGYCAAIRQFAGNAEFLRWLFLYEFLFALAMALFMVYVMREETTPAKTAVLLGLSDR